ncbi:MAG: YjjG family noncanonical pyrimidine nucleotidase [Tunicatimonas sp.]|uniref:YjjG family noncanonical pyrimidine nucleotidase n=1 Tax=Tunicatimonas sp. TaxID=1940096 RepID=UPI003C76B728
MIKSKKYSHILFDLDHTLWDFERCATETLVDLYQTHQLTRLGCASAEAFCQAFHRVNYRLWDLYNRGEYNSERLRRERFIMVFDDLGVSYDSDLPPALAEDYLAICPTKGYVIADAVEVLDHLHQHYPLHIVTNGFSDVQAIKLERANIAQYFQTVTTSDNSGYRKPNEGIFHYALNLISTVAEECIMIGDNLESDILGAQNAGIDHIYFNPGNKNHTTTVTHEITSLRELIGIL